MNTCNPSCVTNIPATAWSNGCKIKKRKGGIPRLTFLKCDEDMTFPFPAAVGQTNPWTNLDNVKWALCQGFLYISGKLVGQKPKGSFQKRRTDSCGPEETISGSKTVTFNDFNADPTNLLDFDFWNEIKNNKEFMFFGYVDCNDLWYQFDGIWDIEVDDVKEDNSEGLSFYDGTITMTTNDIIKPIYVPGLLATLSAFTGAECYS